MATRSTQVKPKQDDWENVSGGDWETVKPQAPEPAPEPSFEDKFRENHPTLASIADTAKSVSDAGADVIAGQAKAAIGGGYHVAKFLDHLSKSIMGLPDDGRLPEAVFGSKGAQEQYADAIEPKGAAQKVGAATVDAVPYIAAEGPIAKVASKAADIAPVASRIVGGVTKFAGRFAAGDAIARSQEAEHPELAGAANATLPILFDAVGWGATKLGQKFQTSMIRPKGVDYAAGYKPENVNKYGVSGTSLPDTLAKTHNEIVSRANELRDIMQSANEAAPEGEAAEGLASAPLNKNTQPYASDIRAHEEAVKTAIKDGKTVPPEVLAQYPELQNAAKQATISGPKLDLNTALDTVENKLLSRDKQLQLPADEISHVRGAIATYRKWANGLPDGGSQLTLDEAQTAKRAIGLKGAWSYGKTDADSGIEKVSNELYNVVKTQLEGATNEAATQAGEHAGRVKQINKELGDLMPIEQALIRRLPVAARNNPLSLTDLMLFATGHPLAAVSHALSKTMAGATTTYALGKVATKVAPAAGALTAGAMGSARQRLRGTVDDDE